ncbi:Hypothetical predicted protein [Mytilus galloprovincialis]|uniref:Uncharacterized protein n=1 Tax=Mytilus galloprovincialis TaxID=29158 RepID=A0A8B6HNU2_MYTGA|nr:Hypothetical predicted protein [Mytilus galloprovincialis]
MSFTEHPEANAAEVEAPLNECALKMLISMPAKSNTVFNHLDNVEVETLRKVEKEMNKLEVFLTSLVRKT